MKYDKMISEIYAEEVPVDVIASVINIGCDYDVRFSDLKDYTLLELDLNIRGNIRAVFRDSRNQTWEALYNRARQSLRVTKYNDAVDVVNVSVGRFIFVTMILALSAHRYFNHIGPVTNDDLKDYMIPARLVKTMLDSVMTNTDIEIAESNNADTNIMSLAKLVNCDDCYVFIENRLAKHVTNVYTYKVGVFVSSNRYDDNMPEHWIHVEAVKQMLQEYKQMLINSKQASKSVTVNLNVTLD